MIVQIMTLVLPLLVSGTAKWNLTQNPVVFGTDIRLTCNLPILSCCHQFKRKWKVGFDDKEVVVNGLSLYKEKYSEELNETEHLSILTIKALDVTDVNIPYDCVYGFWKKRATFELEENRFEYHPSNLLPEIIIDGNNITLNVNFTKVYPVPVCSAELGSRNLSSFFNVTTMRNKMLYESFIKLKYNANEEECKRLLSVNCKVGQKHLRIVDTKIMCSSLQEVKSESTSLSAGSIIGIVLSVIVPLSISIYIYIMYRKRKLKCCALGQRRDDNTEITQMNGEYEEVTKPLHIM